MSSSPSQKTSERLNALSKLTRSLKQKIKRLYERRDQLEEALETMRDGVIALDGERKVSLANQSACELLSWASPPIGQAIEELISEPVLLRFLSEVHAEAEPWVELSLPDQRTVLARLTTPRPSTKSTPAHKQLKRLARAVSALETHNAHQEMSEALDQKHLKKSPKKSPQEKRRAKKKHKPSAHVLLVLSDITALKRLEAVRRDFVANVSHELRTPTTIIQANAETLLDGALDDPAQAKLFLEGIHRHAQRLSRLVSDLLDLSRVESGSHQLTMSWVRLRPLLERVVDDLAELIVHKELKLKLTLDERLELWADEAALEQVLTNLIENAVKYSDPRNTIKVKLSALSAEELKALNAQLLHAESPSLTTSVPWALIKVSDNGPGIPQAHHARIFERFYRVDEGRSREQGGTGLGLAIVKHLMSSMGGAVGISPTPERGSAFWLTLKRRHP